MTLQKKSAPLIAILAAGLAATASAEANDEVCSKATLHGLYVFSASGYNVSQSGTVPKAIVEAIHFEGDGNLTVPAATRSVKARSFGRLPMASASTRSNQIA
jgi:hypothetical protein